MADTDLQINFTADTASVTAAALSLQATLQSVAATVQSVNDMMSRSATQASSAGRREAEQYKRQWDQSIGMVTRDFAQGLVQMAEGRSRSAR